MYMKVWIPYQCRCYGVVVPVPRSTEMKIVEHEWQQGIAQRFPVPRWQNHETVMA